MYHIQRHLTSWIRGVLFVSVTMVICVACEKKVDPNQIAELQVRRAQGIIVDGKLNEPAWKRARSTSSFVSPATGRSDPRSQVQARAKILWNDKGLFVAVDVADRNARSPFQREERDPHIWAKASGIELMLQPGDPGDNRDYYEVQVDVAGAVWDTRFDDYNHPVGGGRFGHQVWDCHCQRRFVAPNPAILLSFSFLGRRFHPSGQLYRRVWGMVGAQTCTVSVTGKGTLLLGRRF